MATSTITVGGLRLQMASPAELETFSLCNLKRLLLGSLEHPANYPRLSALMQMGEFGLHRLLEASCQIWSRERFLTVRDFVAASPPLQLRWLTQRCVGHLRARRIVRAADLKGMIPSIPRLVEVQDVPRFLEVVGRVSRNDPEGYWILQPCRLTPQAFDWLLAHGDGASVPSAVFKHLVGIFIRQTADAPGAAAAIAEYFDQQMTADPEAIFAAVQSLLALATRKRLGDWRWPVLGDLDWLTSRGVIRYIARKASSLREHWRAFQLIHWFFDASLSSRPREAADKGTQLLPPPPLHPEASLAELILYALIVLPSPLAPSQIATAVANVQAAMLQLSDPAFTRMAWELTIWEFLQRQALAVFEEPQLQARLLDIGMPVRRCVRLMLPLAGRLRFFQRWLRCARRPHRGPGWEALATEEDLPSIIQNEHFDFVYIPPPRLWGQRTEALLGQLMEGTLARAQGIVAEGDTLCLRDRGLFRQDIDGLVVDAVLLLALHYVSPWKLSASLLRSLQSLYDARLWPARYAILEEIY